MLKGLEEMKRYSTWIQVALALLLCLAVIALLCVAQPGEGEEFPGQTWLVSVRAPRWIEEAMTAARTRGQKAEWAAVRRASHPTWVVSGAGLPAANGLYYRVESGGAEPYFVNDRDCTLLSLPVSPVSSWAIKQPSPDDGLLYVGPANAKTPAGKWTVGPAGRGPAPTVAPAR